MVMRLLVVAFILSGAVYIFRNGGKREILEIFPSLASAQENFSDGFNPRRFVESLLMVSKKRRAIVQIEQEFPQAVELFSVLISGGMSPAMALAQLSNRIEGSYAQVLKVAVADMKRGVTLTNTLHQISSALDSKMVRRFNDSLLLAIERGTALTEVLAQQVQEVRAAQRNRAIEKAAKAEIHLMIPVVFLILPVSVLFALWPSYYALSNAGTF